MTERRPYVIAWGGDTFSNIEGSFSYRYTPAGPSDDTTEPRGGSLAWAGDSWLTAWMAAIFPYDQSAIFVLRFAKR